MTRGVDDLLADLAEAADAAAELVSLGKKRWDTERPLRLAGEAVIGRLADIATKLPDEIIEATPEIPWRQVRGMRIIAAHAYHQFDAREGGLADSRSFGYFLLGEVPTPADGPELVAQPQIPACLLVLGVLAGVTGLREAPGLEGLPPAVPGHHAFLSKWWVIVMS